MKDTTDKDFYTDVVEGSGLILVDVWADWCPPCRLLSPKVDDLASKHSEDLTVFKLNTEGNANTAELYQIKSIPTLLLFKNGKVVGRSVGNISEKDLENFIQKGLNHVEETN